LRLDLLDHEPLKVHLKLLRVLGEFQLALKLEVVTGHFLGDQKHVFEAKYFLNSDFSFHRLDVIFLLLLQEGIAPLAHLLDLECGGERT